jgi:hypothetical protein
MAIDLLRNLKFPSIPYLSQEFVNPRGSTAAPKRILINASGFGGNCVSILVEKD